MDGVGLGSDQPGPCCFVSHTRSPRAVAGFMLMMIKHGHGRMRAAPTCVCDKAASSPSCAYTPQRTPHPLLLSAAMLTLLARAARPWRLARLGQHHHHGHGAAAVRKCPALCRAQATSRSAADGVAPPRGAAAPSAEEDADADDVEPSDPAAAGVSGDPLPAGLYVIGTPIGRARRLQLSWAAFGWVPAVNWSAGAPPPHRIPPPTSRPGFARPRSPPPPCRQPAGHHAAGVGCAAPRVVGAGRGHAAHAQAAESFRHQGEHAQLPRPQRGRAAAAGGAPPPMRRGEQQEGLGVLGMCRALCTYPDAWCACPQAG